MVKLSVAVGISILLATPARADLSVTSWSLNTAARQTAFNYTNVEDTTVSLPFDFSRTVTHGASTATTVYDFDVAGDVRTFGFDFDHTRDGSFASLARSIGSIDFDVAPGAELHYAFTGDYTLTGRDLVLMRVYLKDITTDTFLFDNYQDSRVTTNASLTLGETGGDTLNNLVGEISGLLTAGHGYQMYYETRVFRHFGGSDSGALGAGSLEMSITTIPAPASVLLGAMGLGVVGWFRRRYPKQDASSS